MREHRALDILKQIMNGNKIKNSFIGKGYHNTITPSAIKRNILQNHYTIFKH